MSESLNPQLDSVLDSVLDTVEMQLKSALHAVERARAEYATVPKYGPIHQALVMIKSAEKTLRAGLRKAQRRR